MSRMQSRRQETASVEQSRGDRTARERAYPVSALPIIAPTNPGARRGGGLNRAVPITDQPCQRVDQNAGTHEDMVNSGKRKECMLGW
jgi:hypothetical protein